MVSWSWVVVSRSWVVVNYWSWVVVSGSWSVGHGQLVVVADNEHKIFATLSDGDYFGEVSTAFVVKCATTRRLTLSRWLTDTRCIRFS